MARTKVRMNAVQSATCAPNGPHSQWNHVVLVATAVSAFALMSSAATVAMAQHAPQASPQTVPAAKATVKKAAKTKAKSAEPGADGETAAAPAKKDPAESQRAIENGIKLYQTGKNDAAIQTISAGLAGGNLPPALMGRALYNRGMAYRKAGKPAQAISDLTSALWLKGGLTDADRSDALQQRSQAYREAGLPDQTDDNGKVAGTAPSRTRPTSSATSDKSTPSAASAPQPTPAPAAPSDGGGFFASLFGGGSTPAAQPVTPAPAAPTQPASSAWTSEVRERKAGSATAAAPPAQTAKSAVTASVAPAAPRIADGKFRARVALARTKADADAIALRLKAQFGQILASREPEVAQTTFGGMGTFFQVRVGPYATKAEATVACSKLKGDGLDCVPVDQ